MAGDETLEALVRSSPVVVFRSPLTDMNGLPEELERSGIRWQDLELGMGESANRDRFQQLRLRTGHPTLPQCFVDGRFVGGIAGLRAQLQRRRKAPAIALAMGYGGLLPFFAAAAASWLVVADWPARVQLVYAAVILSFVGAVHWGRAVAGASAPSAYAWSVVPALVGWFAALMPPAVGLAAMAASFAVLRLAERRWVDDFLPGWFRRLRDHLSIGAVAALILTLLAVAA